MTGDKHAHIKLEVICGSCEGRNALHSAVRQDQTEMELTTDPEGTPKEARYVCVNPWCTNEVTIRIRLDN